MKHDKLRLFLAIPITSRVNNILNAACGRWHQKFSMQKWVHPDDYHITLKFLGDTDMDIIPRINNAMQLTANLHQPFTLAVGGAGTFGPAAAPQVLWAGVAGDLNALHALQRDVETQAGSIGYSAEERPYRSHITLARKYKPGHLPFHLSLLEQTPEQENRFPSWLITDFVLYQTNMGKSPMYEIVSAYKLNTSSKD